MKREVTNLRCLVATLLMVAVIYFLKKKNEVYLVDFVCYQPPDDCRATVATYHEHMRVFRHFDDESIEFQLKTLRSSGIGNESCVPFGLRQLPPDVSLAASLDEVETIAFSMAEDLFDKHNINPTSIDILISNCGHFSPTPSICSMIRNRFRMKSNLMSFNISGMGCSSGVISVCLAKDLLRFHKNSLALVLSFEAISSSGYGGKLRSMLLTNCLFRMGGAAILLGNRMHDKDKAKYVLQHAMRSHGAADDDTYGCITQKTDPDGEVGYYLSKRIMKAAKDVLEANISASSPLMLPLSEKIRYACSVICRTFSSRERPLYAPDFKKAIQHFCFHAGGKAIVDAMTKKFGLTSEQAEPSKMTLYRFGNTSVSSIWYQLCYIEAKGRMKKGDRVWQIAFGSGFKCSSVVWKCVSELEKGVKNAWSDRIHQYPVEVPNLLDY
ncbi:unnamed protein product [Victoria cruziana]